MRTFLASRRAFTLVELLVVIAIIGVLVALLLPAVQQAREAARRMQCTNHLKQLALAMHNYHDTFQVFPQGMNGTMQNGYVDNPQEMTWMPLVLPFLEQGALHDSFDFTITTSTCCGAWPTYDTVVPTLLCPSDPAGVKNTQQGFHGNYVLCLGDTLYNPSTDPGGTNRNGMFFPRSRTKFTNMQDGTSNTLMAGELLINPDTSSGHDLRGRYFNGREGSSLFTTLYPPNTTVGDTHPYCINSPPHLPCTAGSEYKFSSRSQHPGGVMVAMGDASCRFVAETINLKTWHYLGARNDGQTIGEF
ncbi:DUF1559 domain-containing protein [Blastopirellula marina]|uniref:Prepilin-type cleavage/methylation domain-containing protein n=1 Tax=Blastopirellula marina TaxID=124 RepID=A0A2S8GK96_9BACT|nr:DUF1559 domain-containing protein [Blastopirellula marina]PQO44863.1 prepilin-type cleavage/methylation domain-containing protein [Blastopirellula marina]